MKLLVLIACALLATTTGFAHKHSSAFEGKWYDCNLCGIQRFSPAGKKPKSFDGPRCIDKDTGRTQNFGHTWKETE